jgi:hypothetical protein
LSVYWCGVEHMCCRKTMLSITGGVACALDRCGSGNM